MSNNSTIKRPVNTGMHLDVWIDFDNQVHKFYEPVYPGPVTNDIFTDMFGNDKTTEESENDDVSNEKLSF